MCSNKSNCSDCKKKGCSGKEKPITSNLNQETTMGPQMKVNGNLTNSDTMSNNSRSITELMDTPTINQKSNDSYSNVAFGVIAIGAGLLFYNK
jgi:hypothetical protein